MGTTDGENEIFDSFNQAIEAGCFWETNEMKMYNFLDDMSYHNPFHNL